jgi:peptidoglycan/xylan/chitin deacetylase (PgdA/CDA1 family)
VKRTIRRLALRSCKALGVFSLAYGSQWRRNRLLILAYHGISQQDEHEWDPQLYMSPERFAERMETLKRSGCNVLPLAEAIRRLYAGNLPEKSVVITFDDGAYDFYTQAFPILRHHNFPVTVYLTTYYSSFNQPVFEVICRYLLWKGQNAVIDGLEFTGRPGVVDLKHPANQKGFAEAMIERANSAGMSARAKDELAAKLAGRLNVDYDEILARRLLHLMKPEEIVRIAAEGVDVQLHTHRHRAPVDRQLFLREIEDNRRDIEMSTHAATTHFCYPSGCSRREFLDWLREAGIVSATTCVPGLATRQTDRLLLPRFVDTSANSRLEFEGWLSGLWEMLRRAPLARGQKGVSESPQLAETAQSPSA